MTARSKKVTGQHLDNRTTPVRVDAEVCPPPGSIRMTSYAPTVVVTPATTPRGQAAQLAQLRAELTPEQATRWGPVLDAIVAGLRARDSKSNPERDAGVAWMREQLANGAPEAVVKRTAGPKLMVSRRTIDRWWEYV